MQKAAEAARGAALEAGEIQKKGLSRKLSIEHKGTYDLVTDVDRECERAISERLSRVFPGVAILAEEGASDTDGADCWIVDPLDGTTNYARGYPMFCVSIALRLDGKIRLGVVYEPLRDELFAALEGGPATLNGRPVAVSDTNDLEQSLLATGFPYDRLEQPETNLDRFCVMTMRTRGVRRGGSAALDLCYTACGRLDGYWETRLCPWDVAAGSFMVMRAGGMVTDLRGGEFDFTGREILASNGRIHGKMIGALADLPEGAPFFG
ncbi:MAG: inositol monophosphatase [Deltaproteobacteria bacterium]|nr:MAG: inositol monophosphatase [Deltaproteobacteria bacterium]